VLPLTLTNDPNARLPTQIVNDKGRYRQHCKGELQSSLSCGACHRDAESIVDCFSEILRASDIPFRRLHRSVAKQKLDLFEFASTSMAEARATATKIMGREIVCASTLGAPFDRILDYVGRHASILSSSILQDRLNTLPSLTPECRSQTSTSPLHQAGTGTVRSRPPLPIKSTMTQWLSLNCS
jgi:hypothetical protein